MDISLPISSFAVTLFALINPIGNAVIFLTILQGRSKQELRYYALKVFISILITQTIIALIGTELLKAFSISISSFSVAGGALLASIGFSMMNGEVHISNQNPNHHKENAVADPTVVPLTIPFCIGPGVMVAIIAFLAHHGWSFELFLKVEAVIFVISLIVGIVFGATSIIPKLNLKTIYVINRIMGLIVCSMGAQLMMNALKTFF